MKISNPRTIRITSKNVYGETKYYPACPYSESIARIAGTKTLTESTLREIRDNLGYEIELTQPEGIEL